MELQIRADSSPEKERLSAVLLRLTVAGARYLHIVVDADGSLERGGHVEGDFSARLGNRDLFAVVQRLVSPEVLRWAGQSWSDPSRRGKTCELVIGFKDASGQEKTTRWEYGTESPEPPREIRDFVLAIVEATNSWYRTQIELRQARSQRRPAAAFRLLPRRPACELRTEGVR